MFVLVLGGPPLPPVGMRSHCVLRTGDGFPVPGPAGLDAGRGTTGRRCD